MFWIFRLIRNLISLALILFIIALVYGWFNHTDLIAKYISKAAGVKTTIENISFGFDKITANKYVMKNPYGSNLQTAFSAKKIDIDADILDLFKKPHIIKDIRMEDVSISIEKYADSKDKKKSNWTKIIGNLSKGNPPHEKKTDNENSGLIIKHVLLKNVKVSTYDPLRGTNEITLPSLELYDVGDKTKLSFHSTLEIFFKTTLNMLFGNPLLKGILKNILEIPGTVIKVLLSDAEEAPSIIEQFYDLKDKFNNTEEILKNEGAKLEGVMETISGIVDYFIEDETTEPILQN